MCVCVCVSSEYMFFVTDDMYINSLVQLFELLGKLSAKFLFVGVSV